MVHPLQARNRGHLLAILSLALVAVVAVIFVADTAQAQTQSRNVEFTLRVESPDDDADASHRVRRHGEIARIAADRIEMRLDAVGVRNHNVRLTEQNDIRVTVYGRHSADAIKGAVIPPGRVEIRPVITDNSPWGELADILPDEVELRYEPGAFDSNRVFLYSHDIGVLREFTGRIALGEIEVALYPHDDGWRTVNMGPPLATHRDVEGVQLERTPSAIPFVTTTLNTEAAQRIRAEASQANVRHLAIMIDGELVTMIRFSNRNFSQTLTLDCPDFLRSSEARQQWGIQVAGRLAAPIPITLTELQD